MKQKQNSECPKKNIEIDWPNGIRWKLVETDSTIFFLIFKSQHSSFTQLKWVKCYICSLAQFNYIQRKSKIFIIFIAYCMYAVLN